MKSTIIIIILVTLVSLHLYHHYYILTSTKEGFHRRHHRRPFWDGPQEYLYRFRRRNPPFRSSFQPSFWPSFWGNYWFPPINSFWQVPCQCKRGCTPEGCLSPGTHPEDCVWASDCNCCGYLQ
jgi:hypothetical protein